jgi:hypothetical protein
VHLKTMTGREPHHTAPATERVLRPLVELDSWARGARDRPDAKFAAPRTCWIRSSRRPVRRLSG